MRDGAAGGRRPALRRAVDEGLRRRLRARAAGRGADGLPSGRADRLPAAAERRLGARRLPADRAAGRLPSVKRSSRRRSRTGARRSRTRSSSRASPPRERAVAALAIGRPAGVAPRRSRRGVRRARRGAAVSERRRAREDQPGARRRPAAPDGKHEVATVMQRIDLADRHRGSSRRRARGRRLRATRSCVALLERSRREPSRCRVGPTIEKAIPVAAGLGGGARTRPRRSASRTRRSPSRCAARSCTSSRRRSAPTSRSSSAGAEARHGRRQELAARGSRRTTGSSSCATRGGQASTGRVYEPSTARRRASRRERRRGAREALAAPRDLGALPPNDLAVPSPLAASCSAARRVPGRRHRRRAGGLRPLRRRGRRGRARPAAADRRGTWITRPAWYG